MGSALTGILEKLDPYTVLMDEHESSEFQEVAEGRYIGIGITTVMSIDQFPRIVSILDGYSADRAGLKLGDKVISINGVSLKGKTTVEIGRLFDGDVNSEIILGIERENVQDMLMYRLFRTEIVMNDVSVWQVLEKKYCYVKLSRFSKEAGLDMQQTLRMVRDSLNRMNAILKGVVLDLRGNPGGLLSSAVAVASLFLEGGRLVVSTKAKNMAKTDIYSSSMDTSTFLKKIPLVVIVDGMSASASEVVAGAFQDLDRAVILGERTFGKGLVQGIYPLQNGKVLKMTNSEYFTPSGRTIQTMNYFNNENSDKKDSIKKTYKTSSGRTVAEKGGVMPDVLVKTDSLTTFEKVLLEKSLYFEYVIKNQLKLKNRTSKKNQDAELFNDFFDFLKSQNIRFTSDSRQKWKELLKEVRLSKDSVLENKLNLFYLTIKDNLEVPSDRLKQKILMDINLEMERIKGEEYYHKSVLRQDVVVKEAVSILSNYGIYKKILNLSK
ncbi:hypothetical protein CHS0354_000434 [Potamilus streckersoni]|uniref:PDZ domain-containing protein n=1 Tax=Potamilus streckersoni TaxID=2493646 RepID=A0AAE0T6R4_9BIVA|nr:hypothetical protein CHS0354_000434 [Potamilus streckersoni]